ncbi:hypothetical protein QR680_014472 [Steinernema hermaphroditum]|uniref:Uncharacterized protein n=1 Tax=Steinernema hermaphroditum TaxID=289476 RepID=A0AA39M4A4_9BILA|nr:hypothetical protein QR680_014472 [Steinernema hermaphroditum]
MLILTRFWGLRPSFGPKEADFSPVSPPLSSVQLGSVCPESDDKTQFDSIEFTCCNKAKDPANNGNTLARQKAELSLFDKLLWEALRDGNFSTFRTLELQSPDSKLLVEAMVESYSSFLIQERLIDGTLVSRQMERIASKRYLQEWNLSRINAMLDLVFSLLNGTKNHCDFEERFSKLSVKHMLREALSLRTRDMFPELYKELVDYAEETYFKSAPGIPKSTYNLAKGTMSEVKLIVLYDELIKGNIQKIRTTKQLDELYNIWKANCDARRTEEESREPPNWVIGYPMEFLPY